MTRPVADQIGVHKPDEVSLHVASSLEAFAFESPASTNANAIILTVATYTPDDVTSDNGRLTVAKRAFITVEDAQCRYRYDGTAPTATEGHVANVGDVIVLEGYAAIANFQAIRTGTTNIELTTTYER
jgi:hypothetical protein